MKHIVLVENRTFAIGEHHAVTEPRLAVVQLGHATVRGYPRKALWSAERGSAYQRVPIAVHEGRPEKGAPELVRRHEGASLVMQ